MLEPPKGEQQLQAGFPFYTHLILPHSIVYSDWLAGCKGSDRPGLVVCATLAVTLKSPFPTVGREVNNLQLLQEIVSSASITTLINDTS